MYKNVTIFPATPLAQWCSSALFNHEHGQRGNESLVSGLFCVVWVCLCVYKKRRPTDRQLAATLWNPAETRRERESEVVKLPSWLHAGNWSSSKRSQSSFAVTPRPKCADFTSLIAVWDIHNTSLTSEVLMRISAVKCFLNSKLLYSALQILYLGICLHTYANSAETSLSVKGYVGATSHRDKQIQKEMRLTCVHVRERERERDREESFSVGDRNELLSLPDAICSHWQVQMEERSLLYFEYFHRPASLFSF